MTLVAEKTTLSQNFVKGVDYGTEEWCKQLLQNVTSKKLDNVNAFVGVIRFPSDEFLDHNLNNHQTTQFQNSIYVGYMDMLLPKLDGISPVMGYTKLSFDLNGVTRSFIQVTQGDIVSGGLTFKDFILSQSFAQGANLDFVFSRPVMQYLTNIQISGSKYHAISGGFSPVVGSFVPTIEFQVLVSGYKCLLL